MQGSQLQVAEAGFTPDTNEACACSPSQAVFLIWRTHHQPTQYLAKCLVLRRHLIKIYCININTKGVYNLTFRRDHRDLALCWRKAKLRKVRLVIELTTRRECLSLRTVPPPPCSPRCWGEPSQVNKTVFRLGALIRWFSDLHDDPHPPRELMRKIHAQVLFRPRH